MFKPGYRVPASFTQHNHHSARSRYEKVLRKLSGTGYTGTTTSGRNSYTGRDMCGGMCRTWTSQNRERVRECPHEDFKFQPKFQHSAHIVRTLY
eukprot:1630451-Rhodomonas_salina.3